MDFDRAYANSDFIKGADQLPALWARNSAELRNNLSNKARLGLPYGPEEAQKFDLFLPEGPPKGLLVFIHGGYWIETSRDLWSCFAAGPLAKAWAVAMPSYTQSPKGRIAQMTAEMAAALPVIAAEVPEVPVVVTGHSAGGHLAARLASADIVFDKALAARLQRIVPISPLAELWPLSQTAMNKDLALTEAEIESESPARLPRRLGAEVGIWVGGDERPAFLWQARLLAEEWDCPWHVAKGANHFSVLDPLIDQHSDLVKVLLGEIAFP